MFYIIFASLLFLLAFFLCGSYLAAQIRTVRVAVPLRNLPPSLEGFTIIHISDLHVLFMGRREKRLLEIVRNLRADLICITGDFGLSPNCIGKAVEICRELTRAANVKHGICAVLGNSDPKTLTEVVSPEIHVLVNEAFNPAGADGKLWVVGVGDPHCDKDDLGAALRDVPPDAFTLLLAHSPDIIHKAAARKMDLVLCGHTHGGQICLPGIGPVFTETHVGRRYARGLSDTNGTRMFVTTGIGTTAVRVRLFCPPEVAVLRLTRQ